MLFSFFSIRFPFLLFSFLGTALLFASTLIAQDLALGVHKRLASDNRMLSSEKRLKILTWNLHLLPAVVITKNQKARARGIAEVLKDTDYDVIVFQEAFHRRARKLIWQVLEKNFPHEYGPQKGGFIKFSSGVWIISKLELRNQQHIEYSRCYRGTADCRARKGALFVQVEKGDMKFQIIGTHLQAIEGVEYQQVRNIQCAEIHKLLIETNRAEGIPYIVTGDLNTAMRNKGDYEYILKLLEVQDGQLSGDYKFTSDQSTNDMYPSATAKGKVIDYVLINSMGAKFIEVKRQVKIFRTDWRKNSRDLSDHYAVEAELVY